MTGYTPRWFTRPQTVTDPSTNPAVYGRKSNSQPVDHKSDTLTTTLRKHPFNW